MDPKTDNQLPKEKPTKTEVFAACFATCVAVNILIMMLLILIASDHFIENSTASFFGCAVHALLKPQLQPANVVSSPVSAPGVYPMM